MAAEPEAAPRPRGFWSGTLTFGLVSVPVDLFPAVRSRRIGLRMLGPEYQPLVRRYFCSADGKALDNEDIVRGYENDDGSFTLVDDEELDALAPRKSRDIDLRRFVAREEIPRQLLERPYVLAPSGDSTKAYHLLAETMERNGDGAQWPRRHRDVRHARQGILGGDFRRGRHVARRDDALRFGASHAR
jgi:DNA end-binding protein Ku